MHPYQARECQCYDGWHTSVDTCSQLHQLQICELLQHKDRVACPEGLNGKLEALQFTFQELPLWDAATPGEPIHKLIEVDLGSMQSESVTTIPQTPTTTLVLPPLWPIPSSLLVTSPWPSTCSSRGPWNGCSGLPPQPQPLSPSMVCQGESHHWQPWVIQWIPSGQRDRLSHPCFDSNPHADVSMGSHTR